MVLCTPRIIKKRSFTMSIKRMIPIMIMFILVMGLAACQANPGEQAVDVQTDEHTADIDQHMDIEHNAPDSEDEVHPQGGAESDEDAGAEFIPPKPVALALEGEALAFAVGDPSAPVQIIEFTDYQCPYCQRYATQTMPALLESLVESGRVFYAIKDLPLDALHPEARSASVAARCAGEQDAYLQMHDAIFAAQSDWSGTGDSAETIFTDLAAGIDLDVHQFSTCMNDGHQAQNVQANIEEAVSLGVTGTPTFFIEGYGASGAQPYEFFEAVVELAENGELDAVIEAQARQAYDAMQAQQAPPQPSAPLEVALEDTYFIGDPEAPVTIVEYTDFQCPYCARHTLETFTQIEENMVKTGKVRYYFKDLPLTSIHPQAMLAAEAARCADDQDQEAYLAMHNLLFAQQNTWSGQANAAELFADFGSEIGLDSERMKTCLDNHKFEDAVQVDLQEAIELGFQGTPAFLVNGQPVVGAQSYGVFEQAVEHFIDTMSQDTSNN
jgi:protein-disulfide isomerase